MRRARVWCDCCDTSSKIELDDVTLMPELRAYRFRCPACATTVVRHAHPSVIYLLLEHTDEIRVEHITPPIIDKPTGPPIAAGEWVEAHQNLDAWIALQMGQQP